MKQDYLDHAASIDRLNTLLRGELAAVETYDQVLLKFPDCPVSELLENCTCHRNRVPVLTERVHQLGGMPATTAGSWGVLANLTEAGAKILGKDAAISALELGEDRGLDDYRKCLEELDPISAETVRRDLLPDQERTHARVAQLRQKCESIGR